MSLFRQMAETSRKSRADRANCSRQWSAPLFTHRVQFLVFFFFHTFKKTTEIAPEHIIVGRALVLHKV